MSTGVCNCYQRVKKWFNFSCTVPPPSQKKLRKLMKRNLIFTFFQHVLALYLILKHVLLFASSGNALLSPAWSHTVYYHTQIPTSEEMRRQGEITSSFRLKACLGVSLIRSWWSVTAALWRSTEWRKYLETTAITVIGCYTVWGRPGWHVPLLTFDHFIAK